MSENITEMDAIAIAEVHKMLATLDMGIPDGFYLSTPEGERGARLWNSHGYSMGRFTYEGDFWTFEMDYKEDPDV